MKLTFAGILILNFKFPFLKFDMFLGCLETIPPPNQTFGVVVAHAITFEPSYAAVFPATRLFHAQISELVPATNLFVVGVLSVNTPKVPVSGSGPPIFTSP